MSKLTNKLRLIGYTDLANYIDVIEKVGINIENIWSKIQFYLNESIELNDAIIIIRQEILNSSSNKLKAIIKLSLIDSLVDDSSLEYIM